jgi:hypothetical protein
MSNVGPSALTKSLRALVLVRVTVIEVILREIGTFEMQGRSEPSDPAARFRVIVLGGKVDNVCHCAEALVPMLGPLHAQPGPS